VYNKQTKTPYPKNKNHGKKPNAQQNNRPTQTRKNTKHLPKVHNTMYLNTQTGKSSLLLSKQAKIGM
jgi:hypothetical protein